MVQSATWRKPGEIDVSNITATSVRPSQTWPLCLRQFEYAGVGVVQLRFLRFHSRTSSQHMTVSCNGSQSSVGKTNSTQRIIHLMGDSGKEITSHLISISRRDCEVRVKLLHSYILMPSLLVLCDHLAGGGGRSLSRCYGVTSHQRSGSGDYIRVTSFSGSDCCFGTALLFVTFKVTPVYACLCVHEMNLCKTLYLIKSGDLCMYMALDLIWSDFPVDLLLPGFSFLCYFVSIYWIDQTDL